MPYWQAHLSPRTLPVLTQVVAAAAAGAAAAMPAAAAQVMPAQQSLGKLLQLLPPVPQVTDLQHPPAGQHII